jgi:hypothetical protein
MAQPISPDLFMASPFQNLDFSSNFHLSTDQKKILFLTLRIDSGQGDSTHERDLVMAAAQLVTSRGGVG